MPISANSLSLTDVYREKKLMQFSDKIIAFTNFDYWVFLTYTQTSKPRLLENIHVKYFTKTNKV